MGNRRFKCFICVTVSLFILGCAGPKTVSSWKTPGSTEKLSSIYIVGISKDDEIRRTFEGSLSNELQRYDVVGVRSYQDFQITRHTTTENISEQIAKHKTKALLTTRVVSKDSETSTFPNKALSSPNYGPRYYNRGGLISEPPTYYRNYGSYMERIQQKVFGAYPYMVWETARPSTRVEFEIVVLEVNLYDSISEALIWNTLIEIPLEANTDRVISKLINTLTRSMAEQNLI